MSEVRGEEKFAHARARVLERVRRRGPRDVEPGA